jgi:hypothetical protein
MRFSLNVRLHMQRMNRFIVCGLSSETTFGPPRLPGSMIAVRGGSNQVGNLLLGRRVRDLFGSIKLAE